MMNDKEIIRLLQRMDGVLVLLEGSKIVVGDKFIYPNSKKFRHDIAMAIWAIDNRCSNNKPVDLVLRSKVLTGVWQMVELDRVARDLGFNIEAKLNAWENIDFTKFKSQPIADGLGFIVKNIIKRESVVKVKEKYPSEIGINIKVKRVRGGKFEYFVDYEVR